MAKAKAKKSSRRSTSQSESDSSYLLKIVMYLIIGALWLRVIPGDRVQIPLPIGAFIGLMIASRDKFVIDRKIEYGILVIAMFVGFWLPIGLSINI